MFMQNKYIILIKLFHATHGLAASAFKNRNENFQACFQ